ncbi:hypothetical protein CB1_000705024 [Camelus ferus]|nr:hypothetical protein CB1_000705024 [Camelus ferus]
MTVQVGGMLRPPGGSAHTGRLGSRKVEEDASRLEAAAVTFLLPRRHPSPAAEEQGCHSRAIYPRDRDYAQAAFPLNRHLHQATTTGTPREDVGKAAACWAVLNPDLALTHCDTSLSLCAHLEK